MTTENRRETVPDCLVLAGTVTDVSGNRARVKFPAEDLPSGWLTVLAAPPVVETEETAGGQGEEAFAAHLHPVKVRPWTPKINDRVLVLYLPVQGGDGFVLGGI